MEGDAAGSQPWKRRNTALFLEHRDDLRSSRTQPRLKVFAVGLQIWRGLDGGG